MQLGIPDSEFIRDNVPMTKQEIRILSVVKLQLKKDSIVYDVGAGTGSVSIEIARQCNQGKVYAIERKPEAISLIRQNMKKFEVDNMEVIEGEALDVMKNLPVPTHAFIGGSGGNLSEIVKMIREKNPRTRFVINAVTMETVSDIMKLSAEYKEMEILQVGVSRACVYGNYHLMKGENPVYIASF